MDNKTKCCNEQDIAPLPVSGKDECIIYCLNCDVMWKIDSDEKWVVYGE